MTAKEIAAHILSLSPEERRQMVWDISEEICLWCGSRQYEDGLSCQCKATEISKMKKAVGLEKEIDMDVYSGS